MDRNHVPRRIPVRAALASLIAAAALAAMPSLCAAGEAIAPMNVPLMISGDIAIGASQLDIPFTIDAVESFVAEVIVPVTGATFTLIDPSGAIVLAPGDPSVGFLSGSDASPASPLPGGIFHTQPIGTPANGSWTIRLQFAAPASVNTVALAAIMTRTPLQAGIVIPRENYIVGETATMGFLVLDSGAPVTHLSPTFHITPPGGAAPVTIAGVDTGSDPDGDADDGLYSAARVLAQPGVYRIAASVTIPSGAGAIHRSGEATVTVTDAPLAIGEVTSRLALGPGGCVRGVEQLVSLDVTTAQQYVVAARLQAASGTALETRQRFNLPVGAQTVTLFHSADKIRDVLGQDGPYDVTLVDALRAHDLSFAGQVANVGSTPALALASLCRAPLEIGADLVSTPRLRDGYIDAIDFSLTVTTQVAGNYQLSFKIVGPGGEDIDLIGTLQTLQVGANHVTFSVPASRMQRVDGPYSVISGLVVGPAGSAQRAQVGATSPLLRWQFYPTRMGDLDGDGDVDAADRSLLAGFARNVPALQPGDRRDIARDGRLDIRDVRAIQNLP